MISQVSDPGFRLWEPEISTPACRERLCPEDFLVRILPTGGLNDSYIPRGACEMDNTPPKLYPSRITSCKVIIKLLEILGASPPRIILADLRGALRAVIIAIVCRRLSEEAEALQPLQHHFLVNSTIYL